MCAGVHVCGYACVLMYMCTGVHVCWCTCVLVYMCAGVHVCWCTCVLVYMCAGVHVYWCTCVLVYMCAGVHVYWCTCVLVYPCEQTDCHRSGVIENFLYFSIVWSIETTCRPLVLSRYAVLFLSSIQLEQERNSIMFELQDLHMRADPEPLLQELIHQV